MNPISWKDLTQLELDHTNIPEDSRTINPQTLDVCWPETITWPSFLTPSILWWTVHHLLVKTQHVNTSFKGRRWQNRSALLYSAWRGRSSEHRWEGLNDHMSWGPGEEFHQNDTWKGSYTQRNQQRECLWPWGQHLATDCAIKYKTWSVKTLSGQKWEQLYINKGYLLFTCSAEGMDSHVATGRVYRCVVWPSGVWWLFLTLQRIRRENDLR